MAIAEARAAWQRTANRCLVQEDAKRAPKLACCPSSSSSSIKQVDVGLANAVETQDNPDVGFLPYCPNSSYSNLSPDSRWWLYLQPNHGFIRGFEKEQLDSKLSEMGTFESDISTASKPPNSEDGGAFLNKSVDAEYFVDSHFRIPTNCVKNDDGGKKLFTPIYKQDPHDSFKVEDARNLYELEQTGDAGCAVSKNTNDVLYDCESRWIGGERTEPWWRTSDRDELALLVAQRSFGLLENCDLPQPQNTCVKREPFADLCCYDHTRILESSPEYKQSGVHNDLSMYNQDTLGSVGCHLSSAAANRLSDEAVPKRITGEDGPDKAQLLEALRHSQTRAREAEQAAKQAYEEKEHVVKLVFRQASQLFAYKQWFQLLQLENIYFQIKNQNEPISSFFPLKMPWMPPKSRKVRKSWQKVSRAKRVHHPKCDNISKYAVVFALGLSLVGAGLLLGWTAGWLLPTF